MAKLLTSFAWGQLKGERFSDAEKLSQPRLPLQHETKTDKTDYQKSW